MNTDRDKALIVIVSKYQDQRAFLVQAIKDTSGSFNYYERVVSDYRKQIDIIDEQIRGLLNLKEISDD